MIQSETSRSGHSILKRDGRLLASSFDPLREAQGWVAQALQTPGLQHADAILVFGLGCGYHVEMLAEAVNDQRKIFVIEPCIEVAKATLERVSFKENVSLVIEPHARQLLLNKDLAFSLKSPVVIIAHQPSVSCDAAFYDLAQKIFLSREMTSFLLHLRNRPELYSTLDPSTLQKLAASNDPVTIQTLRQLFRQDGKLSHERRVWKALEELIA